MKTIKTNGASFNTDFVRGFKTPGAFIKHMEGNIPDWNGDDREAKLKSVWNEANGKTEAAAPVVEDTTADK